MITRRTVTVIIASLVTIVTGCKSSVVQCSASMHVLLDEHDEALLTDADGSYLTVEAC